MGKTHAKYPTSSNLTMHEGSTLFLNQNIHVPTSAADELHYEASKSGVGNPRGIFWWPGRPLQLYGLCGPIHACRKPIIIKYLCKKAVWHILFHQLAEICSKQRPPASKRASKFLPPPPANLIQLFTGLVCVRIQLLK